MNTHRGHESQLHQSAKLRIGAAFGDSCWTVFFEQKNADVVVLHNASGTIIAIEAESSPRNVLRNITRNFNQGCHAVACVCLSPEFRAQIENKIQIHHKSDQRSYVHTFGYSNSDIQQLKNWVVHRCLTHKSHRTCGK